MRTVLVNPKARRRSAARSGGVIVLRNSAAAALPAANPRRRKAPSKRRAPVVVVANPRRRRRRNGAPLIMPNGRKRIRRRNPISLMGGLKTAAIGLGAGVGSYVLNRYVLSEIGYKANEHWNSPNNRTGMLLRSGLRLAVGLAASFFLPGSIGSAVLGAMSYPAAMELHTWMHYRGTTGTPAEFATPANPYAFDPPANATPTSASLEADLEAALSGVRF